ncbi:MAG TPA: FAD-binding and (Fe-S)-binding domain-containing protein, partial [Kiloniellaceae bacterium]|nr:FAD-binding and (Fe-S)-binding domain-containing protein [Kiloniellaceae bacterium]
MTPVQASHRPRVGAEALAAELRAKIAGDVLFDPFSRGRYSTDASIYQIEPIGVVVPKSSDDVLAAMELAARHELPLLPRGGGTSQCGQTVGKAIVLDDSKYMTGVLEFDPAARRATVEPGLVLDRLNVFLKPHGLMFPVDISTGSRATIGGMAGNNSCGARSLRYGTMRDNVIAIDAFLANGEARHFGILGEGAAGPAADRLTETLLALGRREAEEIKSRFPQLMRRVGGYNIDALTGNRPINLSHLLVGSEGTLAFSKSVTLALAPIPEHKVLGICHFARFYDAMAAAKHIVALQPAAVELVDRTMIELSRDIAAFRDIVAEVVTGAPDALLLVEFAGADPGELQRSLQDLEDLMADLGADLVQVVDPAKQSAVWDVRKAGLNIMMSMKGDGKPVSFIEDCAVALDDLADYTARLTAIFEKHGTQGTWYAHASVGCLHVRPVLNLKLEAHAKKMRAIAEEAFAMVRDYKGSHSGEHGDGLVRSEFHEAMFGKRMVANFAEVKRAFDPQGRMNPGKIVDPPAMDDRSLFRFKPGYATENLETALDWSPWGGFAGAVEMCNNNGACRKRDAAVMCPSYRVTGDEAHVTRGRANVLRLALSGQLGADALTGEAMQDALQLCVGCKGCKRECPTGVDMARMKIEVLHQRAKRQGHSARDRLIGHLPRYAP